MTAPPNVLISFYAHPGLAHPPLYPSTGGAKLNSASVDAGNSDGLCVGAGGVNGQFLADLQAAGQKNANLSPGQGCQRTMKVDDYQERHWQLMAKAANNASAWESHIASDPCAFSYIHNEKVTNASGWNDGVCFVHAFDPKLCPNGDPNNALMVYVAPPQDSNYATVQDFLAAIQATAGNIIKAVAGYNSIAAKQNQPLLECLRNTLFSSAIYNQRWNVPADDIARAIFAGFTLELAKQAGCGLKELAFPIPEFGAVQSDLANHVAAGRAANVPAQAHQFALILANVDPAEVDREIDETEIPEQTVADDATQFQYKRSDFDTFVKRVESQLKNFLQARDNSFSDVQASQMDELPMPPARDPNYIRSNYADLPQYLNKNDLGATAIQGVFKAARYIENLGLDTALDGAAARESIQKAERAIEYARARASEIYDPVRNYGDDNVTEMLYEAQKAADRAIDTLEDSVAQAKAEVERRARQGCLGRCRMANCSGWVIAILGLAALAVIAVVVGCVVGIPAAAQNAALDTVDITASDAEDVDVVAANQAQGKNLDRTLLTGAFIWDPVGKTAVTTFSTMNGSWSQKATDLLSLTYTPKTPQTNDSIQYVLQGKNGSYSTARELKIGYDAATDVVVAAADLTSPVSASLPANFSFTPPDDPDGVWASDAKNNTVTLTPKTGQPVTSMLKLASYRRGTGGKSGFIAFLFPVAQNATQTSSRENTVVFKFPASVAPQLWDQTTKAKTQKLDAHDDASNPNTVTGVWEATTDSMGAPVINYTPNSSLPGSLPTVSAQYVFTYKLADSNPAQLVATLLAASTTPTVDDQFTSTAVFTKALTFTLPMGGSAVIPAHDPNGTWSQSGTKVTFQPNASLNQSVSVKTTYTVTAGGKTSLPGNLNGSYLAAPSAIQVANAPRLADPMTSFAIDLSDAKSVDKPVTLDKRYYSLALDDGSGNSVLAVSIPVTGAGAIAPGSWSVSGKIGDATLSFDPKEPQLGASESVQFKLKALDGTYTAPVTLTATLSTDPVAWPVTLDVTGLNDQNPRAMPYHQSYYSPDSVLYGLVLKGYDNLGNPTSPPLSRSNSTRVYSWEAGASATGTFDWSPGAAQLNFFTTNYTRPAYSIEYAVVASPLTAGGTPRQSNFAPITAKRSVKSMPMAMHAYLNADVSNGKGIAADVLSKASSFYAIDPASVELVGLNDVGYGSPSSGYASADGKALPVPGEGTWTVSDDGKISFQPEQNFAGPPTPVAYRFSDKQGQVSNTALVLIDPSIAQVPAMAANLAKQSEASFWHEFLIHVTGQGPSVDDLVVVTHTLATLLGSVVQYGANPVSDSDFEAALAQWIQDGTPTQDQGSVKGIAARVQTLVEKALPKGADPLVGRFWRLRLMSKMGSLSTIS